MAQYMANSYLQTHLKLAKRKFFELNQSVGKKIKIFDLITAIAEKKKSISY